jgi:hypothetical protein
MKVLFDRRDDRRALDVAILIREVSVFNARTTGDCIFARTRGASASTGFQSYPRQRVPGARKPPQRAVGEGG